MSKDAVELKGFDDINRILDALPKALGPKVVRACLREGVKPYIKEAKQNASNADNTGGLSKSIGILNTRGEQVGITVGTRRGKNYKKGYIAHIVEYGAAPHAIRGKAGKKLAFSHGGSSVVVSQVSHPGIKQQPFLRPAWETKKAVVKKNIGEALKKELNGFAKAYKNAKMR
jgi:HK97 gp10 family phage protein